jgi:hypothetical protein
VTTGACGPGPTGQSCFKICTRTLLTLLMYARSRRKAASSVESLMMRLLMKFLMPSRCSAGHGPCCSLFLNYVVLCRCRCEAYSKLVRDPEDTDVWPWRGLLE